MLQISAIAWSLIVVTLALYQMPALGADPERPQRVVVAGGVSTEIAYLLGAGEQIVGVDATSTHPPQTSEKAQLGYFRRLSAEGVLALSPDLVLASPHAGPETALAQIRSAGVPIAMVPDVEDLSGLPEKITFIGEVLGLKAQATEAAAAIEAEIRQVMTARSDLTPPPRVLFVLSLRDGAPMVAGADTVTDQVIRLAGGENAASFEGYRPMSREAVIAAAPDVLLMTAEHSVTLGGADKILARPEFALTPAGQEARSVLLPALAILGLGPRTPKAVSDLRAVLADLAR